LDWHGFDDTPAHTKPRLANTPAADFNVAHSGDIVIAAVGLGVRVGADVETAPFHTFESESLQRRMLTRREADDAASLTGDVRLSYLARVWTAKEALVKATGEGMRRDFRQFSVPALVRARSQPIEACLVALTPDEQPEFLRLTNPA
jgi:4'-phosphopantetheinyl transferase